MKAWFVPQNVVPVVVLVATMGAWVFWTIHKTDIEQVFTMAFAY